MTVDKDDIMMTVDKDDIRRQQIKMTLHDSR